MSENTDYRLEKAIVTFKGQTRECYVKDITFFEDGYCDFLLSRPPLSENQTSDALKQVFSRAANERAETAKRVRDYLTLNPSDRQREIADAFMLTERQRELIEAFPEPPKAASHATEDSLLAAAVSQTLPEPEPKKGYIEDTADFTGISIRDTFKPGEL